MAGDEIEGPGRSAPSARAIGVGAVVVVLLWFGLVNRDSVEVSFLLGDPRETPLIVALAVSAVLGALLGYIAGRRGERRRG